MIGEYVYAYYRYTQGTGTIWLDDAICTSGDVFLADCSHIVDRMEDMTVLTVKMWPYRVQVRSCYSN